MRLFSLAAALVLFAAGRFAAAAETLNPDRWNTLQFTEGGASTMKGDQITYSKGPDVDNPRKTLNVNTSLSALFPLTDAFSLTLAGGGDWTETDSAGSVGTTASDQSAVTYQVAGRYYFEGANSPTWHGSDNPDRWNSLGLTFAGSATLGNSAANANGNIVSDTGSLDSSLTADVRLPVSTAWTLIASIGAANDYSVTEPTPTAAGAKTTTNTLSLGGGFRYYLVGKNLITNDAGLNPDKWAMVSLLVGAGEDVYAHQVLTTAKGPNEGDRDLQTRSYAATLMTRIPVTDHASVSFSLGGTYNRTFVPALTNVNGSLTRTTPISFSGSLRYFLF